MAMRDLILWKGGRELSVPPRSEGLSPFINLHREMNRLFDDVFRGIDLAPFDMADRWFERGLGWPQIEVS